MSRHRSEVFALAQLTQICHIIVPLCKQRPRECTQIISTNVGTVSGIPQGWCRGRGELGVWTLVRNMEHKALLQVQKVKPTEMHSTSFFPFFFFLFFNFSCTKKNMLSLQQRIRLMETHLQRMPCVVHSGLNQLFQSPEMPWLPVSTGISWRNPKQAILN